MTVEIHGTCDAGFGAVKDAFAANFAQGTEVGASVAIAVDGELVVDLWGGVADAASGTPWERDTIVTVFSSSKTVIALASLLLVERGQLDLDAPVAAYWPEFAANGKQGVLVRHVLSHTSGVSGWDLPIDAAQVYDLPVATARLAAQAPFWEPGTGSGYHAVTQGHLMGEIVRRITGKSFGAFLREELTEPLGADFHVGLAPEHDARVAPIIPPSHHLGGAEELPPDSIAFKSLCNPIVFADAANSQAWMRAEMPASNGVGNARAIARLQSVVSNGGTVDGTTYLSPATIERIFEVQSATTDFVQGFPIRFGIGYGLNGPEAPISPNQRSCYWGGWGGSVVVNDLEARATICYAMNRMGDGLAGGDLRGTSIVLAAHPKLAELANR